MPTEQEQIDMLKQQFAALPTAAQVTALGQLLTQYKSGTNSILGVHTDEINTLKAEVADLKVRVINGGL